MSKNNNNSNLVFNIVLGVAIVILFVLQYNNKSNSNVVEESSSVKEVETTVADNNKAVEVAQTVSMPGDFSVAYVNTDTLMVKYNFYLDAIKKIDKYEKQLRTQYESKALKLKNDYEAYVSQGKAGLLTLQQQKDTEAKLTVQQEELMKMEQRLNQESGLKRQEISGRVTQSIVDFLNGYREENGYTLIMQYGSMSGLLSADPNLDITAEVVERLNKKYDFEKNH